MGATQHPAPRRLRRRVLSAVQADAKAARGTPQRRRRTLSRPALAVGALAAAVVIAVGAIAVVNSGSSPSTRVFAAQVTGERGSAKVAVTDGHAQLLVRNLSPPPAGKIYEVWLTRGGRKPTPTGVLFASPRAATATSTSATCMGGRPAGHARARRRQQPPDPHARDQRQAQLIAG